MADRPTISLADFAELASGKPLQPWQREIADLVERTPPEHLILTLPVRGRFRVPPLWKMPGA